jgi:tRNA-specific 2-thiouridylase
MAIYKNKSKKTVYLGLSGGVDSAVSAYLLREAGYDVHCVFIQTWSPEWMECSWRDDRRDAMRTAIYLGLPFYDLDLREEYKNGVAEYMIEEYRKGRTPNPDVMCNREVKFGGFMQWALAQGADYVATGHYARISYACNFGAPVLSSQTRKIMSEERANIFFGIELGSRRMKQDVHGLPECVKNIQTETVQLQKGLDPAKDQSYFLWTLTSSQLGKILFPVGGMQKSETRRIAQEAGLPVAEKKDSQGVCFLGEIDMKEFLRHYIDSKPGNVIDTDGKKIGTHDGVVFVTLGQRGGFMLDHTDPHQMPLYVVAKDMEMNTITVAPRGAREQANPAHNKKTIILSSIIQRSLITDDCTVQIRYHGHEFPVKNVSNISDTELSFEIDISEPIAVGQSCVFYCGGVCVGGGVVEEVK